MVTVLKTGVTDEQIENLCRWFRARGLDVHISKGKYQTIIGLIGDTKQIDTELLESLDIVESVKRISEPFKNANRKFHPDDTVVDVNGIKIGGGNFALIAGPCSVESPEQIIEIAQKVQEAGASILRGGAFKPRTSPYDFQGLKAEGIEYLLESKKLQECQLSRRL